MEPALATACPDDYVTDEYFDEAFDPSGAPRPHYREVLDGLSECDLEELTGTVADGVERIGMNFISGGTREPFRVDPVPRVFEPGEWDTVEAGLAQRARALNAFVGDLYGDREIVAAGRIPERVLDTAERLDPDMERFSPAGNVYIGISGFDLVRDADGELMVLEDNLRTPSGIAYAQGARDVVDEALPFDLPARRPQPAPTDLLGVTLRAAAKEGIDGPYVVLLSDGPDNSAWWEHKRLARRLGIPLVTPDQLEVQRGVVVARPGEDSRGHRVDVIYRRTDESQLRTPDGGLTWLGEALLEPLVRGSVSVVNSFGTGVADDKLVHAYVEEMVRFYLSEEPLVRSVPTHDVAEPDVRADVLERMDEMVIKPRDGFGGAGVIVCRHADDDDRERAAQLVREQPEFVVAQETIAISTHPTVVEGELQPRHVDLRPFAMTSPGEVHVLPGGLTRVAFGEGALVVNSSQNGGGKDTWVLR